MANAIVDEAGRELIGWTVFALTVLGAVLCFVFLVLHRPSKYFAPRVLAAMGWEVVAFLVLLRAALSLGFTHASTYDSVDWSDPKALYGIPSLLLIDALAAFKLFTFVKFRNEYEADIKEVEEQAQS